MGELDAKALDLHTVILPSRNPSTESCLRSNRFNGGPRICIGQQFALTEMSYTIVRILQRFDRIEKYWQEGTQGLRSEIVLSPTNGVKVGFWEAKSG